MIATMNTMTCHRDQRISLHTHGMCTRWYLRALELQVVRQVGQDKHCVMWPGTNNIIQRVRHPSAVTDARLSFPVPNMLSNRQLTLYID